MAKGKELTATLTIHGDVDQTLQLTIKQTQKSLEDLNKAAKRSEGFTVLKGALANLAADGFKAVVSGAAQAVQALTSLADETRELRADLATLNTAYEVAGFIADQAKDVYRSLYKVIGEEDRSVEAANNISRNARSVQELNDWVTITTGAWATYQDALPIENLAEAAAETARTGVVTGGLADALNWSSEVAQKFAKYMGTDVASAEDAFNVALQECNTEQERQQLINETLLGVLSEAAGIYNEQTGSLQDARGASLELKDAQIELAEAMEPVMTDWTELKTILLKEAAPALQDVAEKAKGALEYLKEHPEVLEGILTAAGVLGGVLTVAATAMTVFGIASAIAAAGMTPFVIALVAILATIALVMGAVYLLMNGLDWLKGKLGELKDWWSEKWENIKTIASNAAQGLITGISNAWADLSGLAHELWDGFTSTLKGIWDSIVDKASSFASGVKDAISSKWQGLKDILTSPFDSLSGLIDSLSGKLGRLANKASSTAGSIRSRLPAFASGGFTNGPSIAGEAGTEAVISFDPRYRADNLRYWQQAGSLLGVDYDSLSLGTGGYSSTTDVGGITFAPNITVTGNAQKQDIIDAIRETYPEFMDLIDEVLADREVGAYA